MHNLTSNTTEILLLLFLIITFGQSGYDKIADWKGNVSWLKQHFANTFLKNYVPLAVFKILVIELIATVLCVVGIFELISSNDPTFAMWGAIVSCLALLALLFGQRIAKDYDGARTIAIYFMVAVFAVYLLAK
ncbi:DoxX family protein [Zhouia spongiae]|uniref:DoxX family protein n=1 Tax=Zhouia spongiae TaxID=2202721 RepID=A0ABY3YPM3_9FLAO|nr:DoxX family protein [Zhouia spongiae]UNY99724.1 DoxX family protein [Zhouia spongiae]